MKTQIILVEPHDSTVSLRDKLSWVKAQRALLLFPPRSHPLLERLDLLLLQRQARSLGFSLGLVTCSTSLQHKAKEIGMPVFADILEAQKSPWPPPPRKIMPRSPLVDLEKLRSQVHPVEPAWLSRPAVRMFFFSLAVLALLAIFLILLPKAEIHLQPVLSSQSLIIAVHAVPGLEQVSLSGQVPARQIFTIIEGSNRWNASGQIKRPRDYAQGTGLFQNLTNKVVGIPAGTVIQTLSKPPIRFHTLADSVVEAGPGSTVEVPVRALWPGSSGNLPPNSLVVIEGSLGASLSVTNPQPTQGGSDQTVPAPSSEDRSRLYAALLENLSTQALEHVQKQLAPGDLLLPSTLKLVEILDEAGFPPPGQAGDTLTMTLKARFSIFYITATDLQSLAMASFDASLPEGYLPLNDTITIIPIGEATSEENGNIRLNLQVQRSLKPKENLFFLARLVRGRKPSTASDLLVQYVSVSTPPEISLTPSWWPWLPFTEWRIVITD